MSQLFSRFKLSSRSNDAQAEVVQEPATAAIARTGGRSSTEKVIEGVDEKGVDTVLTYDEDSSLNPGELTFAEGVSLSS